MRRTFLLSVFTLTLAVFTAFTDAQGLGRPYFGFNLGYSYQELELKGVTELKGVAVSNANIKEDGFFLSPKAGIFLRDGDGGGLALEFEPRWSTGAYEVQTETETDAELDGTLQHFLFPLTAIVNANGESAGASLGIGSGVHLYDFSDEIQQTTSVPLIFKVGFWFSTAESTKIGLDAQLTVSVWESESNVDNIVSAGFGLKVEF